MTASNILHLSHPRPDPATKEIAPPQLPLPLQVGEDKQVCQHKKGCDSAYTYLSTAVCVPICSCCGDQPRKILFNFNLLKASRFYFVLQATMVTTPITVEKSI